MFGRSFGVFAAAVVFMLSAISLGATYGGGSGTVEDPYQIWTPQQMNTIGANSADWDKHFKLMDNIDMSAYTGTQYSIIGKEYRYPFTGKFDGNGHVIRNLTYMASESDYVGVFGYIYKATIKNLAIENANMSGDTFVGALVGRSIYGTITSCSSTGIVQGATLVGGLVGESDRGMISFSRSKCSVNGSSSRVGGLAGAGSNITKSYATGRVVNSAFTENYTGGLVGTGGTIDSCYATGAVIGNGAFLGGLMGQNGGTVTSSFAKGSVSGSILASSSVGGLVGYNWGGTINSSYAMGAVIGRSSVGGLVGYNSSGTIESCYSVGSVSGSYPNVGGLVGGNWDTTITSSFWDMQTSGKSLGVGDGSSQGAIGKLSEEMEIRSTFVDAGWDFTDIWAICEGTNYPRLRWQIPAADWVCPDGVNTEDLDFFSQHWLLPECDLSNNFCEGADINTSGKVDLADFAVLAERWIEESYVLPSLPSPISWWKMDETSGSIVSDNISGFYGRTRNVSDNPWVVGQGNNALKLDGVDDYVDVVDYKGVWGKASRTCTAWIKANSTGKEQVILSWGNGANGQKWIVRVQADGKLAAAVWGGYIQGSVSVADGQWHHVAVVLADDGSPSVNEIKLYVDGIPQTVTSSSSQAINTVASQNVQMGSVYNGTAQASFFGGLLDEVRIYDVPLMGQQILRVAME